MRTTLCSGRTARKSAPIGTRLRIFLLDLGTGGELQLIPEATQPARPNYRDHLPAWARLGTWDY